MSRGKVYYKFKNAASGSFTAVEFPGLYLPLIDLKASIVEKKFPRALEAASTDDFELRIVNAQTGEELLDDDTSVAKNTCVLVSRLPPGRRGGLVSRLKSNKGMRTKRRHHVKQGKDEMKARLRDNKEAEGAGVGGVGSVGGGGGSGDDAGEDDDIFGADVFDQKEQQQASPTNLAANANAVAGSSSSSIVSAAAAAAIAAASDMGGVNGGDGGKGAAGDASVGQRAATLQCKS